MAEGKAPSMNWRDIRKLWVEGQTEFKEATTDEQRAEVRTRLEKRFNEACAERIPAETRNEN
jgi:hypothetical protein